MGHDNDQKPILPSLYKFPYIKMIKYGYVVKDMTIVRQVVTCV